MRYLDLETLDTFAAYAHLPRPAQLAAMRFGLATLYDDDMGTWTQYWSEDLCAWQDCMQSPRDLALDDLVQSAYALSLLWNEVANGSPIIGWNVRDFDIPYLMLQIAQRTGGDRALWSTHIPVIDLFAIARDATRRVTGAERWYPLQTVAQATLGMTKTATGTEASQWLASKEPAATIRAAQYCRADVDLVRRLFEAATTTGMQLPPRPERGEAGAWILRIDRSGTMVAMDPAE